MEAKGSNEPRHLLLQLLPLQTRSSKLTGGANACVLCVDSVKRADAHAAPAQGARIEPQLAR
jgi:hypothetical protein